LLILIYGLVNLAVTKITGIPPYAAIDWKTWVTYVEFMGLICVAPIIFFLWSLVTDWRYSKYSASQFNNKRAQNNVSNDMEQSTVTSLVDPNTTN
jgi:hypothetical protein